MAVSFATQPARMPPSRDKRQRLASVFAGGMGDGRDAEKEGRPRIARRQHANAT